MNPPTHYQDGRVEHDAETWIRVLHSLLKASSSYAAQNSMNITRIALTTFRSAVVPVDREGNPLSKAVMWQDKRTDMYCGQFSSSLHDIYARTRSTVSSVFSALKMRWFRNHEPGIYSQTYKMAGIQDLLLHALTGRFITDEFLAGRTSLMNIYTRQWDPELQGSSE